MMEESEGDIPVAEDQLVSQLSDAVQAQVTLAGPSSGAETKDAATTASSLPPLTALPDFSKGGSVPVPISQVTANLSGQNFPSLAQPSLVPQMPQNLGGPSLVQQPSNMPPPPHGGFQPAPPAGGAAPSAGAPPPRAGFQPVPNVVQNYESHHPTPASHVTPPASAVPASSTQQTGISIFTPAYDPNAQLSHYSMPPTAQQQQQHHQQHQQANMYSPPPQPGGMHAPYNQSGGSAVELSLDASDSSYFQGQSSSSQDKGIIDWFKSNETVNKMVQKAKSGVQYAITAMDPQMKDVLYSGGDVDVLVTSGKEVKYGPVKDAFQQVFGRATVNGMDSQPDIAPQPVGYTAGIKGAESRIDNLRRSARIREGQVCVSVESFIVDLQPEMWYDISCLLLSDPVNNITLQTFTQATPVSLEYVHQAQNETPPDYHLSWSGLSITVGHVMHRQCAVDPSDWHFYFTGISRRETIFLAAKQLAFMYKQRLPRH